MGIIDLAILVGIGFVIAKMVAYGKDRSRDYARRDRIPDYTPPTSLPAGPIERSETEEINFRTGSTPQLPPSLTPKQVREKRMAELKRQYVADEITVEQFETELDKLMREDREG